MRQAINSLADCGMNLCSRSRFNLKTDGSEPSTLHIHILCTFPQSILHPVLDRVCG
ncbi:hypothetical protein QUA20_13735 [Microcoleus sp. Pol7_A1]|uniref:hypothetical protein n=1 Tax=Microcoleus sp. Pol7_A1 TaxID=2818893 RepID=UPI002FD6C2A0